MGHGLVKSGLGTRAHEELFVGDDQVDRYLLGQFRQSSAAWLLIATVGVPVLSVTLWITATDQARLAVWLLLMLVAQGILVVVTVILRPRVSVLRVGLPAAVCGTLWGLLPHIAMPSTSVGQGHLAMSFAFILPCCVLAMSTVRIPAFLFNGTFGVVWLVGWIRHAPDAWQVVTPALAAMLVIALISTEMLWRTHRRSAVHAIRARRESEIDPLTGLLNRRAFAAAAERHLSTNADGALIFIDLDDFSLVSDLFGYDVGDHLLIAAAGRLRRIAPHASIVGRVGGDEIAVFIPHATDDDLNAFCTAITNAFRNVFILDGHTIRVDISIGVARTEHGRTLAELLPQAHQAMLEAKRVGAPEMLYSPELSDRLTSDVELRARLARGLDDGEFAAYLQPVVHVSDGRVLGFEALARWETSDRVIPAAEFHDAAAASGMLPAITRVVATQVIDCIAELEPTNHRELLFAINVDLADLGPMLDWIVERVDDPNALIVEITEHENTDQILTPEALESKLESGLRVVLDDFGVAFSSFGRVLDLPIAGLKIDASFVRNLTTSRASRAVVEAILTVGKSMNLTLVAEGVETAQQSAELAAMGITAQQGYLHGRPLPISEALLLLE